MPTTKETVIRRLRELKLVTTSSDAEHWLIKEKIPSLGNKTAAQVIIEGHADAVLQYLENVSDGGYA